MVNYVVLVAKETEHESVFIKRMVTTIKHLNCSSFNLIAIVLLPVAMTFRNKYNSIKRERHSTTSTISYKNVAYILFIPVSQDLGKTNGFDTQKAKNKTLRYVTTSRMWKRESHHLQLKRYFI